MRRQSLTPTDAHAKFSAAWQANPDAFTSEAVERSERIRPVMTVDGKLHYVVNGEESPAHAGVNLTKPDFYLKPKIGEPVKEALDTVAYSHSFLTWHKVIGKDVLEPTPLEILMQIPDELVARVCAYEVKGKMGWHGEPDMWSGMIALYGLPRIPQISDEELNTRAERIRPLTRKGKSLMGMELPDLKRIAFLWDPKLTGPVKGLKKLATITTYHTYAYHGFFKPTIAEVLAQIPDDYLESARYFEVQGPENVDDLNKHIQELDEGYHVAVTTLYK